jgi:hypothetical protein
MYGLGSFIKKAVKGVTGAVKSFAKSDAGKLALLAAAGYGLGGGTFLVELYPVYLVLVVLHLEIYQLT